MSALGRVVNSSRRSEQDAALLAARQEANSSGALYVLAVYQLEIGRRRDDDALRAEALDRLIHSSLTPRTKLPSYLDVRGGIAFRGRDYATANNHWSRLLELRPNDPRILSNLAQVRLAENDAQGAADLLRRAAEAQGEGGQPVSEVMYRQRLSIAFQGRLVPQGVAAAHALILAYPTPRNWRDAMVGYRQLVVPQDGLEVDFLRLMHSVGAFANAAEYLRLAQLLTRMSSASEARALLDEGVSRRLLDAAASPTREIVAEADRAIPRDRARLDAMPRRGPAASPAAALALADALLGARAYAEAIPHFRAALAAPSVNAAEVNCRLGMALVLAGRSAEAEAAFRLAAGDAAAAQPARYGELAQFWLAWLAQST